MLKYSLGSVGLRLLLEFLFFICLFFVCCSFVSIWPNLIFFLLKILDHFYYMLLRLLSYTLLSHLMLGTPFIAESAHLSLST